MCWCWESSWVQLAVEMEGDGRAGRVVERGRDGGLYCSLLLRGNVCLGERELEREQVAVHKRLALDRECERKKTYVTDLGWLYLPMHCLFTNGGPLGQSAGRSTRHRRRINRQKADERHREINVDGVVERDTECVRDINEFGATDGYQSGLHGVSEYFDKHQDTYRNLDTHIPMAALARLDTCPPAFTGDASCAMTCEVALNRFFCDFSPLCLCRAAAVCRSARCASFRECADVLQEREAEVFDLICQSTPLRSRRTFRALPFRTATSHQSRCPLTQVRLPTATRSSTRPCSPFRLHPRPFSVYTSTGSMLGARTTAGLRQGMTTMGR